MIDIPIDHLPGAVKGDGPSANLARSAMGALLSSWEKIRDAASDPAVPLERLARASTGAMEKALRVADEVDKKITAQIAHLEGVVRDATQPKIDPALAMDIRSYWRERDASGLAAAVSADARTASAVLSAPPYLSGLDEGTREGIRAAAMRTTLRRPPRRCRRRTPRRPRSRLRALA